jgi:anaerobic ribonucleoside-triphosphate reductase
MFNCCLVNIKDMFENGTVMNGKLIETPKSFQVACTVMTQIIASVASGQFGGQSVNIKHLGKYLAVTRKKYQKKYQEQF